MINQPAVKKITRISPVWIVPFVAFVIAIWLAVQARLEKGTEIEIRFESASDIVPEQTQIRLKDVKVGIVKSMKLSKDLKQVVVRAEIDREISVHLSENTRFWVVTPRISTKGVSNLGTLISGVYIVMDPGEKSGSPSKFIGLDEPPLLYSDETGTDYVLRAETLGSLDIGSPIYYRQISVGEITGYKLAEDFQSVDISFFIRAPYDKLVLHQSRFWNVSGFNVSLGAEGLKAKMASLSSLVAGGVEFENDLVLASDAHANEGHRFELYSNRKAVLEERFTIEYQYLLKFSGSIRGLTIGAPVEFKGVKVGEVADINLAHMQGPKGNLHVFIGIEPQRFETSKKMSKQQLDQKLMQMIARGLRAKISTSSLLTGSKYIELAFMDKPAGELIPHAKYAELPTSGDAFEQLTQKLDEVLGQVANIPFEDIGTDLSSSMSSLRNILKTLETKNTALKIDGAVANAEAMMGSADDTVKEMEALLESFNHLIAPDSEVKYEMTKMLKSLSEAADSLQLFLGELNRHPNALITGAKKDE